jgi:hypothetical protein
VDALPALTATLEARGLRCIMPEALYLWVMTLAAFGLFGHRVYRYVETLRGARPETRWDQTGRRLRLVLVNVLGQRRVLEEPVAGVAHLVIFWAFVCYAAGFFWNLVRGLLPFLPIPYADEVWWMRDLLAVLGIVGLAGLAVAAVRRYFFPPPSLEKSRDASIILGLIAVVLLSSLAGQWWRVSSPTVSRAIWWVHMVTVLGFLAYLPYSKHLHLLASPFGVFFASLEPGRVPDPSPAAARSSPGGNCSAGWPARSAGVATGHVRPSRVVSLSRPKR